MNKSALSGFTNYLKCVSAYKTITEAEIHEMYRTKDKESVVEEIILRNLKFVFKLAIPWIRSAQKMDILEDLICSGTKALILATRRYDPKLGSYYKFISRYIGSYFEMELYRFSNYSRVQSKRMIKMKEGLHPNISLSQEIGSNGEEDILKLEDILVHPGDSQLYISMDVENLLEKLKKAGKNVHKLAPAIIQLRYGIGNRKNFPELSLAHTAKILGLSKEGVRKIEQKALAYLRHI